MTTPFILCDRLKKIEEYTSNKYGLGIKGGSHC